MVELTALSSRKGIAIATFLNFYVSDGSATRFLRNGEKYYIYFIDILLLFPTVKEFSISVNSWWSYRKKFDTAFISETQCIHSKQWVGDAAITQRGHRDESNKEWWVLSRWES